MQKANHAEGSSCRVIVKPCDREQAWLGWVHGGQRTAIWVFRSSNSNRFSMSTRVCCIMRTYVPNLYRSEAGV